MKTLLLLFCLTVQFALAWSQTESDFENQKGLLTSPLVRSESVNQHVVSVYSGEVVAVMHNKGFDTAVLIRHGNYFTVYSGLKQTSLTRGMLVAQNQEVGTLLSADDSKFHFEIWNGTKKLEPLSWLACHN